MRCFCLYLQATKSSLSENEKREKRAMERKISEMEEELKVISKSCDVQLVKKLTRTVPHEKLTQNSPHSRLEKREKQENLYSLRILETKSHFLVLELIFISPLLKPLPLENDQKVLFKVQLIPQK